MPYTFYDSEVVNIIDETPNTKRYFIKINCPEPCCFKAGQFVMLDLPIDSKIHTRSYSIASAPSGDNIVELLIVLKQGGLGTTYIFDNIHIGSMVKCSLPLGKFSLPDEIDRDICFISTGTGIAPLRSMLVDMLRTHKGHKNVYLIFGNRWKHDILYKTELKALERELPHFTYIPVLSRQQENWIGQKGYVHPIYEALFVDKRPAYFYICGWTDMLKEARQRIEAMGYEKQYIKFEAYD